MAGHNKWSKVKRLKGALDAKRGKIFSKLSKEITVATRMGGGDPNFNPRLRSAVLAARAQNMPNDNIDRAIKKGTGEIEGAAYEEIAYEGYAPAGVALIVETATDNKNRTAADLRLIFTKNHGNLASSGSVSYMFHRKGLITIPKSAGTEEQIFDIAIEAGAEDIAADDEYFSITTSLDHLYPVAEALKSAGIPSDSQKLTYLPDTTVQVADEQTAAQVLRLCEALEDNEDVQAVHANFDIPEDVLARLSQS
ncbi:MAG TPA: YebC/PmpR family DNA-binding transcriptional regulator [Chthoniobacterales bacterium]